MYLEKIHEFSNGVKVLCCTPHDCTFEDNGSAVIVEKCGALLAAEPVEELVRTKGNALLCSVVFRPTENGLIELENIKAELGLLFDEIIIAGSLISAQAYPGVVCGLIPAPGFMRVKTEDKRMRCDKFTIIK